MERPFRKLLSALVVLETVGKRKEHVTNYGQFHLNLGKKREEEQGKGH